MGYPKSFRTQTVATRAHRLKHNVKMPELPEVEVTRRGLLDAAVGRRIHASLVGKPLRWPLGCADATLAGRHITGLARRGKYLLFAIEGGCLIVHLGMSGSLRWADLPVPLGPHEHFGLDTDRGGLRLRDPRRFGAVIWHPSNLPEHPLLAGLGPEPLLPGFDGGSLHRALAGRRAPIKAVLLDQSVVAGLGNIYVCEALFAAGIDPRLPAGNLSAKRCRRLAEAIRTILDQAIAMGGSTLRDFAHTDGGSGHFQLAARVYGRANAPCDVCGRALQRIVQGQRSTYFCAGCQRA